MKRAAIIACIALSLVTTDASAFWWLLRTGAARGAAGAGVRAGAVGAATEAEALAASRICIRPVGNAACDFRTARSTAEAASKAVGPGYQVRPGNRPNVFEVLDAAGNVVSLIEAISSDNDPNIVNAPEYHPNPQLSSYSGNNSPVSVAPLRHNGDILNIHVNGVSTVVWSDGSVDVWADGGPRRTLSPGERLNFPNYRTVYAAPRSSDAYTIFWQPSGHRRRDNNPLSADNCPSGFRMINGRWTCMDR